MDCKHQELQINEQGICCDCGHVALLATPKPSPMPEHHVSPSEPYETSYCATRDDAAPCGACPWCRFTTQLLGRPYRSLCTQQDDEGRCLTTGASRLRDDDGQEG